MKVDEAELILTNGHAPVAAPRALDDAVAVFTRWLHLADPGPIQIVLAAAAANRADGDPLWLLVVGPPSGGKTELLGSIAGQRDVHPAATLTEAALLSGTPKRERADGSKGGLLREIGDYGIIVAKDFGSVLSMNRDTRAAVLAALREIYDGAWTRHVGTDGGRTLSWSGKVGLIAGCTPAIDNHHAVVGAMGERFVMYRMPAIDADAQTRRALAHVGRETAMRAELAAAADRVLASVDEALLTAVPDEATTARLVNLSTVAVRCRSAVERDGYRREIELIPEPEAPARLALTLLRLLNGLRAIGVDDAGAWRVITKAARDSMPAVRRTVLEILLGRGSRASTSTIAAATDYPTITIRRALEDLTAHGIADRQSEGQGHADTWAVTDWARDRWPTVSEMSVGAYQAAEGVSEMSGDTHSEHENGSAGAPISLPLRIGGDKSEKVPDDDDGYGPGALEVDPDPAWDALR